MSVAVAVRAPCRLHFGMFSFGHVDQAEFGGVGVMIEPPNVEIRISPSAAFSAIGAHALRVEQFVRAAIQNWALPSLPNCTIECEAPADHVGLGVGTQLGLAVAAGIRRFLKLPELSVQELALSIGRGRRSAVGTYGFQQGGLIVDAGKTPGEEIGKLDRRVALPVEWRFVLVRSPELQGLAGEREASAFANLPLVPDEVTFKLWQITSKQMLPAIEWVDCEAFGNAVYEFGRLAGKCFAAIQGGAFASPAIEELVSAIRQYGVRGVGQSSWGPTVFAITSNDAEAERLAYWIRNQSVYGKCEIVIARPNYVGASVCDYASVA